MPYGITPSYLPPGRGSISRPYPGRYSICPLIKDQRLTRPEPTQANDLPRVATEVPAIPSVSWLCPTRHNRCEQLAHSCYAVTCFSGIRTRVFQTRVERAIHSANHATKECNRHTMHTEQLSSKAFNNN